jgi:ubiquinone biosynthesis protein
MIRRELDLALEASHMERFARNFENDDRIYTPEVYREYSTEHILTMEYVTGVKISHLDELEAHGLDREILAQRGAELMLQQVFEHGFFHADPHPGNILVQDDNVYCLLDYGTMGSLTERFREQLSKLIVGFTERDERRIVNAVFSLSGYTKFLQADELEADIANFIDDHLYRPFAEIKIGTVLSELTRLLLRHEIKMPSVFFLLLKCITTMEGVARQLVPDFDLLHYTAPFAKQLMRERISPRKMVRDLFFTAADFRSVVRELPNEIRQIVSLFKHGEIGFRFEHRGLDEIRHTHDQVSNRVVFGIVLAALIVGSSIMVLSRIPPTWHEIPIFGVAGFVISGIMGFSLLYSIIKHGKM